MTPRRCTGEGQAEGQGPRGTSLLRLIRIVSRIVHHTFCDIRLRLYATLLSSAYRRERGKNLTPNQSGALRPFLLASREVPLDSPALACCLSDEPDVAATSATLRGRPARLLPRETGYMARDARPRHAGKSKLLSHARHPAKNLHLGSARCSILYSATDRPVNIIATLDAIWQAVASTNPP